jgi:DNA-binding MarR family transcriptional regulator
VPGHGGGDPAASDHVDAVRAAWQQVWPELDTSPIAVVARVGRLAAFFDQGIDRAMAAHGLSRSSWDILATLRRGGPPYEASPTEMYRGLMRSSGWIAKRLSRLEHAGLITRHPDPADARALGREDRERLAVLLRTLLAAMEREQPFPPGRRDRI